MWLINILAMQKVVVMVVVQFHKSLNTFGLIQCFLVKPFVLFIF